ncbi:hypothetical protein H9Q10_08880 [Eikenella sp. S3360]|uniref:Uncharacterized protein n=1 Tax=Eikenella glucosivorans TaxID=2766967 RepID=A0ABS0NBT3_9NEIS|nr:hypothetical protein [Eikenella glucosivorans]MBH5329781.1 hypothetical protein [Eikenella glucosivorans]
MKQLTLAAIAALLAAPAIAADDGWLAEAQQINRNIVRDRDDAARQIQLFTGKLRQGRSQSHTIRLEAGKQYSFFADCDRQCSNLDLALADSSGKTLKQDTDADDNPIISWNVAQSGEYQLTVSMPACEDAAGCDYSAQAFEQSPWLPRAQKMNRDIVHGKDSQARQAQIFNGSLAKEQSQSHSIQLSAGKYYSFFADCGYDCSDIDLSLKAADGRVIKEDTDDDDSPMFGWRANRSGRYTVTVTIPKCDSAQCGYSSQVFVGNKAVFE